MTGNRRNLLSPPRIVEVFEWLPDHSWADVMGVCPVCTAAVKFLRREIRAWCTTCGQKLYRPVLAFDGTAHAEAVLNRSGTALPSDALGT